VEGDEVAELAGDPFFHGVQPNGTRHALDDVRLVAPIIPRSKVVCFGRNYAEHAKELGNEVPDLPLMFLKPNTSVVGPGEPVRLPSFSDEISYEGELAVVIGRICKDVPVESADEVIFGYTCANDLTARDCQRTDGQWARAKGWDGSCPLGPWIETQLDPDGLSLKTTLDGDLVQDGSTSDMIHGVRALVAQASAAFTLLPGDVLLTGTPAGVGLVREGQRIEVSIEGIGTLTNQFLRA
jgi:2-keto-4-pentenoate hydratase/2-oxohepta-3-ene-1,7-dioic acid hydratase in catechol pathway